MSVRTNTTVASTVTLVAALLISSIALANGGPFVIKYPSGDPAARGVSARIDPDLKPGHEERLRVVKEDLTITFGPDPYRRGRATTRPASASEPAINPVSDSLPLADVTAAYTIENPSGNTLEVDFGFPILRGIYREAQGSSPDVRVCLDKEYIPSEVISYFHIYGMIRYHARDTIEKAIAADPALSRLVAQVRAASLVRQRIRETIQEAARNDKALSEVVAKDAELARLAAPPSGDPDAQYDAARTALAGHLQEMKWEARDVALMVEFASLDFRPPSPTAREGQTVYRDKVSGRLVSQLALDNLGVLSAIGQQKATQFFAGLATRFNPAEAATYEGIFSAWGGDIRERSLDLQTGEVRPREFTLSAAEESAIRSGARYPFDAAVYAGNATVYARVDYLDPNARLNPRDKASCETILKNLPVVFTFAPMNLVSYRVKFPARSTHTLTVRYKQFAYGDTRAPASCQLAYVVHPASLWKTFGPINLEVLVPENVPVRASTALAPAGIQEKIPFEDVVSSRQKMRFAIHRGTVTDKTGELFIATDSAAWTRINNENATKEQASR